MTFEDLYNHNNAVIRNEFRRLAHQRRNAYMDDNWKQVAKLDNVIFEKFGLSITPWTAS